MSGGSPWMRASGGAVWTRLALLTGLYLGNGRHTGVDNELDSGVGVIWGVMPSFSWEADRRLWDSGAVVCGGTDVDVERSILVQVRSVATFVVFTWETVGAGPFSFNAWAIYAEITAVASTTLHHFPWGLATFTQLNHSRSFSSSNYIGCTKFTWFETVTSGYWAIRATEAKLSASPHLQFCLQW